MEKQVGPGCLLDIGCGTARGGIVFASAGWKVTGIDISTSMLALTMLQALEAKVEIKLSRQDMRALSSVRRFDLVTCFSTLNHLLKIEEMEKAIIQVVQALRIGGFFAADLLTPETLSSPRLAAAAVARDVYLLRFEDFTRPLMHTTRLVWFKRKGTSTKKWNRSSRNVPIPGRK